MKKNHITIPFFIPNLGCPNRCVFCDQGASTGVYQIPDRFEIDRRVNEYLKTAGDSTEIEIGFFGGSFTSIEESIQDGLLEAANDFYIKGLISGIRISTRPDAIDEKILTRLKSYNVSTIEIGAQSFDDDILRLVARGHTADQIRYASELIKGGGFKLVLQVMTGLPGDDYDKSIASAEAAARLIPDAARIYPLIVIKGTPLEKMYNEKKYFPLTIEEAVFRSRGMLKVFNENNIPVIRIGVHPFNEYEIRKIAAGPYHPAFGFFVRSALRLDELTLCIDGFLKLNGPLDEIKIIIPLKKKEEYIGHKKCNIETLKSRYGLTAVEYSFSGSDELSITRR